MPEREELLTAIVGALSAVQAFGYAAAVAIVRVMRDEHEAPWRRIALEAAMCGLLAQGLDSAARYFFDWQVPTFIAACVGLLGPEWVRKQINSRSEPK